jgi:uncharacterized protein
MTLLESLKKRALEAMKVKDSFTTTLLRLAAAEIQMLETRCGRPTTEDEAAQCLRRLMKSNDETLAATVDPEQKATLVRENALLAEFLPKSLDIDALVLALGPVLDAIRAAPSDGPATGIAMKHLKTIGAVAQGADVTKAVAKVRAPN